MVQGGDIQSSVENSTLVRYNGRSLVIYVIYVQLFLVSHNCRNMGLKYIAFFDVHCLCCGNEHCEYYPAYQTLQLKPKRRT